MFQTLTSIGEPFRTKFLALQQISPRLAAGGLLLLVAWGLAALVRRISQRSLQAKWLEWLLQRSGLLSSLADPSLFEPRRLLATVLYWSILLAGGACSLDIVSSEVAGNTLEFALAYLLPKAFAGLATVMAAHWLGRYCGRATLIRLTNESVDYPWRWAFAVHAGIVTFGIALASEFTGVASSLIRPAFLLLLAGVVFSVCYGILPGLRMQMIDILGDRRKDRNAQRSDDALLR